jgi:hypothetical protein
MGSEGHDPAERLYDGNLKHLGSVGILSLGREALSLLPRVLHALAACQIEIAVLKHELNKTGSVDDVHRAAVVLKMMNAVQRQLGID